MDFPKGTVPSLKSRNVGMKAVLGGFESRLESEAELVAADEDGSGPEPLQELEHEEVVIGLHSVPHNGTETLEGIAVGGEVADDLRLAVKVEGAPHRRGHDVLNPDPVAVQVPIGAALEAMFRRPHRQLRRRGRGGRGDGGAEGEKAAVAAR
jgi:hypothetical protein